MEKQQILDKIRESGVVGAGGAGFPTHIKLSCNAEVVIANGAECEPLLRTDRLLMETYPKKIMLGLKAAMYVTGAKRGVIALKKKYAKAVEAMRGALDSCTELHLMDSFYPAGDEQQIVYEVTGKVVPTGGLPIDVGAVVQNVSTLIEIANALQETPVIKKYVTVTGEVAEPAVYKAPLGMPFLKLIEAAAGPKDLSDYSVIIGGPMMGRVSENIESEVVEKTTGGVIVIPKDHKLVAKKTGNLENDIRLAKSVCCQCNYCTQLCPRNALGLKVEPHKIMRALALNADNFGYVNGIFSCCDCGVCTQYACNFQLAPSRLMTRVKQELAKAGVKPEKKVAFAPADNVESIKVPVSRLMIRLGIEGYDRDLALKDDELYTDYVRLPLKMHIGAPAVPAIKTGDSVTEGQVIASVDKGVGAKLHASISGVAAVADKYIEIRKQ
jgi:Na+-translocating ferredoxin:NAD+ oxidoreductase RnfC subunit